jgi:enoyl-CoA hydratase
MATIRTEDVDGGVRVLTLDRPPANALDATLLAALDAALEAAGRERAVRAVVVTGAGAFFSAGFDLGAPLDDTAALDTAYTYACLRLLALPKPTVALLNGHAVAAGLVLALACDYRLGCEGDHRVGLNQVAVGVAVAPASLEIVRLRLSHQRATELLLGASLYPASQAVRLGLVDELLPADGCRATVLRRAARMGAFPREAYAHAKAALVAEAVARIRDAASSAHEAAAAVASADESRAARARQREKLGRR